MKGLICVLLCLQSLIVFSQTKELTKSRHHQKTANCAFVDQDQEVFEIVSNMPEYNKGADSLVSFLKIDAGCGKAGIVYVSFVVLKNGQTCDFKVPRGLNESCNQRAIEKVRQTANDWSPGKHKGEAKNVSIMVPVMVE